MPSPWQSPVYSTATAAGKPAPELQEPQNKRWKTWRRCYADPEVNVGTRGALSPTNASSELRGKSNDDGWQLRERPASPELPFGPCPDFKVSMDHFEPYRSASQWPLHPRPKQEKSKEPLASGGGSRSALRKETGPAGGSPAPTHRSSYSRTNPPPPPSLWILSPGLGGGCRPVSLDKASGAFTPPAHQVQQRMKSREQNEASFSQS
ncbi:uncharacterized protein LOC100994367 [Pan paniscus]|uniref:uncharacterized protein LOC100994367 n=1 Tax=Pan paniscus TaxID=9597 RepID=UPI0024371DAD|nr:uncharacterized protein LOC100994367 [Pan paniscus]